MKTIRTIAVVTMASLLVPVCLFAQLSSQSASSVGSSNVVVPAPMPVQASAGDNLRDLLIGMNSFGGGSGSVLVVPAGQMSVEDLASAIQDTATMARVFDSMLKQAGLNTSGMNSFSFSYSGPFIGQGFAAARNIYLQGYGVLFTMNVGFPLSPGPAQEEAEPNESEAEVDPVWQQAQQDLYQPQRVDRGRRERRPEEKYSPERVESLKRTLITSLKHAANIRGLQPSESVIVTVIGQAPQGGGVTEPFSNTDVYVGASAGGIQQSSPTVLTIRAKVADIQSYAQGDLDLDQFRSKVQVLSNPYLGAGSGAMTRTWISTGVRTIPR
jgi:hypothetical protein